MKGIFAAAVFGVFAMGCGGGGGGGGSTGGAGGGTSSSMTCDSQHSCTNGSCRCSSGPKKDNSCCDPNDSSCTSNKCDTYCKYCQ